MKKFSTTISWGMERTYTSTYEFDTQAELDAFFLGVNEASDWLDFEVIEEPASWKGDQSL